MKPVIFDDLSIIHSRFFGVSVCPNFHTKLFWMRSVCFEWLMEDVVPDSECLQSPEKELSFSGFLYSF